MNKLHHVVLCSILAGVVAVVAGAAPSYTPLERPDTPEALQRLKKLDRFELDGLVDEWGSSPALPVLGKFALCLERIPGAWKGPRDAGAVVRVGYVDSGLCIAATVTDDETVILKSMGYLWKRDALEFHIDLRDTMQFGSPERGKNFLYLSFRPPTKDSVARIKYDAKDSTHTVRCKTTRNDSGYTAEFLITWPRSASSAHPYVGIMAVMNDYDPEDGSVDQPTQLSLTGLPDAYRYPDRCIPFAVGEHGNSSSEIVSGEMPISAPFIHADTSAFPLTATVGPRILPSAAFATITTGNGTDGLSDTIPVEKSPTIDIGHIKTNIVPPSGATGKTDVTVRLHAENDSVIGISTHSVRLLGAEYSALSEAIAAAKLRKLAHKQPYKAAAWCKVASTIISAKRMMHEGEQGFDLLRAESVARIALLQDRPIPSNIPFRILTLLNTGSKHNGAVNIQIQNDRRGAVLLQAGSIPLVGVDVRLFDSENDAREFMRRIDYPLASPDSTVPGTNGRLLHKRWVYHLERDPSYDSHSQFLLLSNTNRKDLVIDTTQMKFVGDIEGVVRCGTVPQPLEKALVSGVALDEIPVVDSAEAHRHATILVVGPESGEYHRTLGKRDLRGLRIDSSVTIVMRQKEEFVFSCVHGSGRVAERAVNLIAPFEPIAVSSVDSVAADIVQELQALAVEQTAKLPGKLFCGDVHMHTLYSDGAKTPDELALNGVYVGLDFAVLTDHNTLDGYHHAQKTLPDFGLDGFFIPGEEITAKKWHANAYPLTELIGWNNLDSAIQHAHRQGAVIQLNHPGYPNKKWAASILENGFGAWKFDAWEHIPPRYAEWAGNEKVPVMVGSTDTHAGFFIHPERTLIASRGTGPDEIADAIRKGNVALVNPGRGEFLYCHDKKALAWFASFLSDPEALRKTKAGRLRKRMSKLSLETVPVAAIVEKM